MIAFLEEKPDPNFLIDPTFVKTWPENRPAQGIQRESQYFEVRNRYAFTGRFLVPKLGSFLTNR